MVQIIEKMCGLIFSISGRRIREHGGWPSMVIWPRISVGLFCIEIVQGCPAFQRRDHVRPV